MAKARTFEQRLASLEKTITQFFVGKPKKKAKRKKARRKTVKKTAKRKR